MFAEHQRSEELTNLRRDIQNQFQKVANNISHEIDQQMLEFEKEIYDDIQVVISKEREQQNSKELNRSKDLSHLTSIRKVLDSALVDVMSLTRTGNHPTT
jgi:AAA15 family ATPase/GTPase